MVQIYIYNDDAAHDLFATVTDLNTQNPTVVLAGQRIPVRQQVSANVQEDGIGNCLVAIHTVSADDNTVTKDFNNQVTQANVVINVHVF